MGERRSRGVAYKTRGFRKAAEAAATCPPAKKFTSTRRGLPHPNHQSVVYESEAAEIRLSPEQVAARNPAGQTDFAYLVEREALFTSQGGGTDAWRPRGAPCHCRELWYLRKPRNKRTG